MDYQAYLLRLRRLDNDGQPVWRISLESLIIHRVQ